MISVVSPEDVFDYLGQTPTDVMLTGASIILDGLQADLEAFLRKPIVPRTFTEDHRTIRLDSCGRWRPRNLPILAVSSVTVDGVALVLDQDWSWASDWIGIGVRWTLSASVTYTAGMDGDDPTSTFGAFLRAQLIRKAAAVVNKVIREDQAGLGTLQVEGTSYSWAGVIAGNRETWTDDELDRFRTYRRRIVR